MMIIGEIRGIISMKNSLERYKEVDKETKFFCNRK